MLWFAAHNLKHGNQSPIPDLKKLCLWQQYTPRAPAGQVSKDAVHVLHTKSTGNHELSHFQKCSQEGYILHKWYSAKRGCCNSFLKRAILSRVGLRKHTACTSKKRPQQENDGNRREAFDFLHCPITSQLTLIHYYHLEMLQWLCTL